MEFGTLATRVVAAAAAVALTTATAQAAPVVRASSSIPAAAKSVVTVREGRAVQSKDNLLGAPLFVIFLGVVAVTVGTIIIINKSKG